jgi:hypothetical protein
MVSEKHRHFPVLKIPNHRVSSNFVFFPSHNISRDFPCGAQHPPSVSRFSLAGFLTANGLQSFPLYHWPQENGGLMGFNGI